MKIQRLLGDHIGICLWCHKDVRVGRQHDLVLFY